MLFPTSEVSFSSEVLDSPQPVIVHFWAPWCKICQRLEPMLLKFQQESPHRVRLASVNADESLKLVNTYRVKILPTVLVFEQGQLIHRVEGFQGLDDTARSLRQAIEQRIATTA
ncbi:thioredoxin family protein [Spirulina subsalsa]|uniref:thioredoxin family protein n=1 Tax=Spirulina subsalsa TaxID=54311 RepID=UPI00036689D0|nr:thioredoxin family protein [Spirulina subsalsa]